MGRIVDYLYSEGQAFESEAFAGIITRPLGKDCLDLSPVHNGIRNITQQVSKTTRKETPMDENQVAWNEKVAEKLIKNLEKRRMEGSYAATAAQAKDEVVSMITPGSSVFRCGTMTATYAGLWDAIAELPDVSLIDPYEPGIPPEEGLARRSQGMMSDFMIASSNAITLEGKLVNLDDMGNRVAAMSFGPKKVILMVCLSRTTY